MRYKILAFIAFAVLSSTVGAQIVVEPDADLWFGDLNPDGSAVVPILQYDPANGEMWINTLGLNRVIDTGSRQLIGGDDVGTTSISVPSPPAISVAPEFMGFYNGCVWNSQHFAGKQQVFGCEGTFLAPNIGMRVWTFDAGLTPNDFGEVEMAINYGSGIPGGILFGQVQFVPEPSGYLVAISLGLGLFLLRRIER